jgi:hypothetical protein
VCDATRPTMFEPMLATSFIHLQILLYMHASAEPDPRDRIVADVQCPMCKHCEMMAATLVFRFVTTMPSM